MDKDRQLLKLEIIKLKFKDFSFAEKVCFVEIYIEFLHECCSI